MDLAEGGIEFRSARWNKHSDCAMSDLIRHSEGGGGGWESPPDLSMKIAHRRFNWSSRAAIMNFRINFRSRSSRRGRLGFLFLRFRRHGDNGGCHISRNWRSAGNSLVGAGGGGWRRRALNQSLKGPPRRIGVLRQSTLLHSPRMHRERDAYSWSGVHIYEWLFCGIHGTTLQRFRAHRLLRRAKKEAEDAGPPDNALM